MNQNPKPATHSPAVHQRSQTNPSIRVKKKPKITPFCSLQLKNRRKQQSNRGGGKKVGGKRETLQMGQVILRATARASICDPLAFCCLSAFRRWASIFCFPLVISSAYGLAGVSIAAAAAGQSNSRPTISTTKNRESGSYPGRIWTRMVRMSEQWIRSVLGCHVLDKKLIFF